MQDLHKKWKCKIGITLCTAIEKQQVLTPAIMIPITGYRKSRRTKLVQKCLYHGMEKGRIKLIQECLYHATEKSKRTELMQDCLYHAMGKVEEWNSFSYVNDNECTHN